MPALRELQAAFDAAVFEPASEAALLACIDEDAQTGRRRLAAYRNSIYGNLIAALASTYPVVGRIVGGAFFRSAVRAYVDSHPSRSGDLNEYGEQFAGFLAGYPGIAELPYLPDVARLEWLVQGVYYGAEAPATDLARLAEVSPERWGELRFDLHPARARIDSKWPLDAIWRVNHAEYAGDMSVDFSRSSRLLVLRRDGLVHVETVDAGEAVLIDALGEGETLGEATGRAVEAVPDFDLGAALRRFVTIGLLRCARLGASAEGQREGHD